MCVHVIGLFVLPLLLSPSSSSLLSSLSPSCCIVNNVCIIIAYQAHVVCAYMLVFIYCITFSWAPRLCHDCNCGLQFIYRFGYRGILWVNKKECFKTTFWRSSSSSSSMTIHSQSVRCVCVCGWLQSRYVHVLFVCLFVWDNATNKNRKKQDKNQQLVSILSEILYI